MSANQERVGADNAVAAAEKAVNAGVVLLLSTDEISLPDITDVRPFTSKNESEAEITALQALMKSIEEEGQIEPIVVMAKKKVKEGEPRYDIVAGRRRLRAITMHNLAAETPMKIQAVLSEGVKKASTLFRRSLHENVMREGINAIDMAQNFRAIRENMDWRGPAGTKKVAEFAGCSPAQVTQHEKLLELDEEFQRAVAEGRLMREGAYALLKVEPEKRAQVFADAVRLTAAENGDGVGEGSVVRAAWDRPVEAELDMSQMRHSADMGPEADAEVAVESENAATDQPGGKKKGSKRAGGAKRGGVTADAVRRAAREADPAVKQPRSRKDMLEFFEGLMGPAYGHANGSIHGFCAAFASWAKGDIGDRALEGKWKVMVEKAERGTAAEAKPAPKADKPTPIRKPASAPAATPARSAAKITATPGKKVTKKKK